MYRQSRSLTTLGSRPGAGDQWVAVSLHAVLLGCMTDYGDAADFPDYAYE